jgi:putative intracellular protease/amidase
LNSIDQNVCWLKSHRFKNDDVSVRFLNDQEAQQGYKATKMLSSCAASDYKALFFVGGHGPGIYFGEKEAQF